MELLAPMEFIALGLILGTVLGMLGFCLWKSLQAATRPRRSRSNTIACLMCGRRNRITPQERERSCAVCRCGQALYIHSPASAHERPRR